MTPSPSQDERAERLRALADDVRWLAHEAKPGESLTANRLDEIAAGIIEASRLLGLAAAFLNSGMEIMAADCDGHSAEGKNWLHSVDDLRVQILAAIGPENFQQSKPALRDPSPTHWRPLPEAPKP